MKRKRGNQQQQLSWGIPNSRSISESASRKHGNVGGVSSVSIEEKERFWKFVVDYNDHFETPREAYEDLLPLLRLLATHKLDSCGGRSNDPGNGARAGANAVQPFSSSISPAVSCAALSSAGTVIFGSSQEMKKLHKKEKRRERRLQEQQAREFLQKERSSGTDKGISVDIHSGIPATSRAESAGAVIAYEEGRLTNNINSKHTFDRSLSSGTALGMIKESGQRKGLLAVAENGQVEGLRIYDPYFCQGGMKAHLAALGVTATATADHHAARRDNHAACSLDGEACASVTAADFPGEELPAATVINENRDFYADILTGDLPEHDMIVTNPPYSGDHKQRLLQFLLGQGIGQGHGRQQYPHPSLRPFALLLPAYVATKSYWREFVEAYTASRSLPLPVSEPQSLKQLKVMQQSKSGKLHPTVSGSGSASSSGRQPQGCSGKLHPTVSGSGSASSSARQPQGCSEWGSADLDAVEAAAGTHVQVRGRVLYLLPPSSYEYAHPEGTGKDLPPFYSVWFIGIPTHAAPTLTAKSPSSGIAQQGHGATTARAPLPHSILNTEAVDRLFLDFAGGIPVSEDHHSSNNRRDISSSSSSSRHGAAARITASQSGQWVDHTAVNRPIQVDTHRNWVRYRGPTPGPQSMVRPELKLVEGVEALVRLGAVNGTKRPNPKQRKKKLKQAASRSFLSTKSS